MVLQRWDPFLELRRIHNRLYRSRLGIRPGIAPDRASAGRGEWSIPLDIVQENDRYVVRASLPGIARKTSKSPLTTAS